MGETPYQPPEGELQASPPSAPSFYWRIPLLVFAALVASVPFHGFFVLAGRDSQLVGLLIILCWLATWPLAIVSVALAVVWPPSSRAVRWSAVVLTAYLLVAGVVGWQGVRSAFFELIVG